MRDLRGMAGELAADAMDRMLRRFRSAAEPPQSAIAWSSEAVFQDGDAENASRYIQVVIYFGRAAPQWPDPAPQIIRELPHYPDQGELLL